jgi:hypothetical protein
MGLWSPAGTWESTRDSQREGHDGVLKSNEQQSSRQPSCGLGQVWTRPSD